MGRGAKNGERKKGEGSAHSPRLFSLAPLSERLEQARKSPPSSTTTRGDNSNKRFLSRTVLKWKLSRKSWISSRLFVRKIPPNNLKIPDILTSLLRVSRKIFQVSRFPAKSSDSRKIFIFLPKQTFLELTPPRNNAFKNNDFKLLYNASNTHIVCGTESLAW